MSEWSGRVAFISGGVSGLGLGIAKAFSDAGITDVKLIEPEYK